LSLYEAIENNFLISFIPVSLQLIRKTRIYVDNSTQVSSRDRSDIKRTLVASSIDIPRTRWRSHLSCLPLWFLLRCYCYDTSSTLEYDVRHTIVVLFPSANRTERQHQARHDRAADHRWGAGFKLLPSPTASLQIYVRKRITRIQH
jgi:hypothetical protein